MLCQGMARMNNRNGVISISMGIISIILFFLLRGPDADLMMIVPLLASLSAIGIIFAILSRRWLWCIVGAFLNGLIFAVSALLFLAYGIAH